MSFNPLVPLAVCLLVAGCGPASQPEASSPPKPKEVGTNQEHLRRALANIQSYLGDLEGRLRISNAQTWRHEAAAAQRDLGNIMIELGTLRAGSQPVGSLEGLLSDLEGRLRGASAENWSQSASDARQMVGSIRMELENLSRGL